mgnify:CR=1 FL=1
MTCHIQRAMEILGTRVVDDRVQRLAGSLQKMKNSYAQHDKRKADRRLIMLDEVPKKAREAKRASNICKALTLKGKPCTFKAVNGCYCKKHTISKTNITLGRRVNV